MSSRFRYAGFTLVELLVVLSIIALLAAILLPSLRKARKQARSVYCAANLHGLGTALQTYLNEYNGFIPREIWIGTTAHPYALNLALQLGYDVDFDGDFRSQLLAMPEFQCPDFPRDNVDAGGAPLPEQALDHVVNNFPYDYTPRTEDILLAEPDVDARARTDVTHDRPINWISQVRGASGIVYISEGHRSLLATLTLHDAFRGAHLPRGREPRVAVDQRHPGGINALFYDGHVDPRLPRTMAEADWFFGAEPEASAGR